MADLTLDTVSDAVRDAFYIGVGAGVLTFQKLQVQRVELTKAVSTQLDEARGTARGSIENAKDGLGNVSELVEERVKLLEREATLAQSGREAARGAPRDPRDPPRDRALPDRGQAARAGPRPRQAGPRPRRPGGLTPLSAPPAPT